MAKIKKAQSLKIGVLKPDNIGDAVLASPFFFELRKKYPKAQLIGILSPAGTQVLDKLEVFDRIVTVKAQWLNYKKTGCLQRWISAFSVLRAVNREKFDLLIGMRFSDRLSALILSLANAKKKIGYDVGGMGFGIDDKIKMPSASLHETEKNALLLRHMGIKPAAKLKFGFSTNEQAKKNVEALLKKGNIKKYIVVAPVSGFVSKDYKQYAAVINALSKKYQIVVDCGSKDKNMRELFGENIFNLTGMLSIKELGELIRGAKLVIGNDSAAVHIAGALGVNSLTVFSGAGKYEQWAAAGKKAFLLVKETECRGCELTVCNRSGECLDIAPETVVKAALGILSGRCKTKLMKAK